MDVTRSRTWTSERAAVTALFFVKGLLFATWVARIPDLKSRNHFSDGNLGAVLLVAAAGVLLAMPLGGRLAGRVSAGRVAVGSTVLLCGALTLVHSVTGPVAVVPVVALVGLGNGGMEVPINALGVQVERRAGRPLLSSMHAAFSIGTIVGAAVAAVLLAVGASAVMHTALVAGCVAVGVIMLRRRLPPDPPRPAHRASPGSRFVARRLSRPLVTLGVLGFCGLFSEAVVADWVTVYVRDELRAAVTVGAVAYAAFTVTMTAGRLAGDRAVARLGPVRLLAWSGTVVAAAAAVLLLASRPVAAVIGFGVVGLALSVVVPTVYSAVGRVAADGSVSRVMSAVTPIAYTGVLLGPAVVGVLSARFGLSLSLAVLVVAGVAISTLGSRLPSQASGGVTRA